MARYGPAKNANLACLFVGRGRYHGGLLSRRSRARRDVIDLTENFSVKVALDAGEQRAMRIAFRTGGVAGMFTVGLGLFGAALVVLVYAGEAPKVLEGFGFVNLFANFFPG